MNDCVFCKIVAKQLPSDVLYEDDRVLAFRDINPLAPVHILIIPKRHVPSLKETRPEDAELLGALLDVARQVAADAGLEGYRVAINTGRAGGQVVPHLHLHVIGGKDLSELPSLS
ncbi:MAG: histidine triad nucleotide-binding protein [Bacillota bacterium]|jgi:histidine triad (HIT) family protein